MKCATHGALGALGAIVAVAVLAIAPAFASQEQSLPPIKEQGSVKYLTGGVGKDEARAVRNVLPQYSLSLEFVQHAKPRDEFLADVDVEIKDHKGRTVLKTVSDGPFLLANVPPGDYTVKAEGAGKMKVRRITVAEQKPEHVVVVW